eukprot:7202413-Karenia_brevis.AAC.1
MIQHSSRMAPEWLNIARDRNLGTAASQPQPRDRNFATAISRPQPRDRNLATATWRPQPVLATYINLAPTYPNLGFHMLSFHDDMQA